MQKQVKQISDPRVLFVTFENQGGDWTVRIPHAYGKDKHFEAPVEEALSLQFQPVRMVSLLGGSKTVGVACVPLKETEEEESEDDKAS